MTEIKIRGYVREVGDFNVTHSKFNRDRRRGIEIECADRYVLVIGLSREECVELAGTMFPHQEIELVIGTGDPE